MAYAALVSLTRNLDQILDQYPRLYTYKRDIRKLHQKLDRLLLLLEESSGDHSREDVKSLENKIRDAAYHAEDIIESRIIDHSTSKNLSHGGDGLSHKLYSLLPKKKSAIQHHTELRKMIKEFDSFTREVVKIMDQSGQQSTRPMNFLQSRPTIGDQSSMVGFEEDLMQIKDRLCNEQSKLQIIPIVGMGGIGKTTLTQNIYDDSLVTYHFYIRAWVTLSQEYCMREILLGLVNDIVGLSDEMSKECDEKLGELLYKSLKGKRYLVVIDDVWNTKPWDDMKMLFPDDNNGSRIILTTRLTDVADYVNSSDTHHHMRLLNEEESLDLFRMKIFGQESFPPELEDIGNTIVRNCQGLPLSIVVIGGLLSNTDKTREYWGHVAENLNSIVTENDNRCSNILTLSYNYLPHRLKVCFLYMGGFPEDYEIPVSKLTKLWAAEGFLKPQESKLLEEIAEEGLKDLIDRNLIFVCRKGSSGTIKTCKMHDLLRDLCIRTAQTEKFLCVIKNTNSHLSSEVTAQFRHLIVHPNRNFHPNRNVRKDSYDSYNFIEGLHETMKSMPNARSFLLIGWYPIIPRNHCSFRLLRVLDMVETKILWFPKEILNLVNLRYLAINCQEDFPSSIAVLRNLQTLIIHSQNPYWRNIVSGFWVMPQLRHFKLFRVFIDSLEYHKPEFPVLENLQTLSRVEDFGCRDEVLKKLPNLKKLGLYYSRGESFNLEHWCLLYSFDNLFALRKLEKLKIQFRFPLNFSRGIATISDVRFPSSLKKMTLEGCKIPWKYMWVLDTLPNLEVLKLHYAFVGEEWEPTEEQFPKLKFLQIWRTDLVYWKAESTHFPRLEHLILRECSKLEEIPSGIGEIPTLQTIKMDDSSPSAVDSAYEILEEQQSYGNETLQVIVEPCRSEV